MSISISGISINSSSPVESAKKKQDTSSLTQSSFNLENKICSICNTEKPIYTFKEGDSSYRCCKLVRWNELETLITEIYKSHKIKSASVGKIITYSEEELFEQLNHNNNLERLHAMYVASNYDPGLKPTCRKYNSEKNFILDNYYVSPMDDKAKRTKTVEATGTLPCEAYLLIKELYGESYNDC